MQPSQEPGKTTPHGWACCQITHSQTQRKLTERKISHWGAATGSNASEKCKKLFLFYNIWLFDIQEYELVKIIPISLFQWRVCGRKKWSAVEAESTGRSCRQVGLGQETWTMQQRLCWACQQFCTRAPPPLLLLLPKVVWLVDNNTTHAHICGYYYIMITWILTK